MAADYGKVHRLLRILTLIQGRRDWTSKALAIECGVVERTIFRDIKIIAGAGIPVHYDAQTRGYQLPRSFFMKPTELALDEALALIALGERIGGNDQLPLMRPAARAVAKIRSQLPDALRRELDGLDNHLDIQLARATSADGVADVYDKVRRAIANRKALRCQYDSVSSDRSDKPFLFKPYALMFNQRAWYVLGHHQTRRQVRCLKLNRFTSLDATEVSYVVPKNFSVHSHLGNAWRMIRGEPICQVQLRFDPAFAETIADTQWHRTQQVHWQDDGSILLECTVDGLDEIVWWVLSMGPHCQVIQPPELARRVRQLARDTAAIYD